MKTKNQAKHAQLSDGTSRREFLKSSGKIAIYTPPAIMLLMKPNQKGNAIGDSLRGTEPPIDIELPH